MASDRDTIQSVDLTAIRDGDLGSASARAVSGQLLDACSGIGFVTVRGHGVSRDLLRRATEAANTFFALPDEAKYTASPRPWNPDSPNVYRGYFPSSVNGKEGLDIGDPGLEPRMAELVSRPYYEANRIPDALSESWRGTIARYFEALSELGVLLMRALATALGGDAARVDRAFARPRALTTLRLNYYPVGGPVEISKQDGAALCCETHVDSGFLTILHQGTVGGLQVRDSGRRWVDVPADPGTFVVNTGLALERISRGVLAATRHRVLQCREERVSIPFFLEPAFDTVVGPTSIGLQPDAGSEPVVYEDFLRESLAKFAEYAREAPRTP